ncbi:MAG: carbohydrate-binding family 9-like protein [Polyangiaceae bacterium]
MSVVPGVKRDHLLVIGAASMVLVGAIVAVIVHATRERSHVWPASSASNATELVVPHVNGSIALDGDLDDTGWLGNVARTGAFLDKNGDIARPYSEARLTWGDGVLYLSLYAADEDIRATATTADGPVWRDDSFHFVIDNGTNERIFDVSASGVIADATRGSASAVGDQVRAAADVNWNGGVHVSREIDGTLNDSSDDDEEWALEIVIPFEAIGLKGEAGERVRFAVHRCDSPKREPRVCASWGERNPATLILE